MPPIPLPPVLHLSRDMAGLIAQVYPTLIIALLLEGRLRIISHRRAVRIVSSAFSLLRLWTILTALYITTACLVIVSYPPGEDSVDPWVDVLNTVVIYMLLLTISWSAAAIWIRQIREDNKEAHIAAVKAAEEQRRTDRFRERAQHAADTRPDAY